MSPPHSVDCSGTETTKTISSRATKILRLDPVDNSQRYGMVIAFVTSNWINIYSWFSCNFAVNLVGHRVLCVGILLVGPGLPLCLVATGGDDMRSQLMYVHSTGVT